MTKTMANKTMSYETPQVFEVELEIEGTILTSSGESGTPQPF